MVLIECIENTNNKIQLKIPFLQFEWMNELLNLKISFSCKRIRKKGRKKNSLKSKRFLKKLISSLLFLKKVSAFVNGIFVFNIFFFSLTKFHFIWFGLKLLNCDCHTHEHEQHWSDNTTTLQHLYLHFQHSLHFLAWIQLQNAQNDSVWYYEIELKNI